MQRSSAVLLIAGATGLLVTLGVLVRAVRSDSSEPAPTSITEHESAAPSPQIASRTPDLPGRPAWHAPAPAHGEDSAAETTAPTGPSIDDHAPPATKGNTKNMQFGGAQLRAQADAVRPAVEKCVAEKGGSTTGTAMVTYIVAQQGDKIAVEDTGIDDSRTTVQGNTELLDCLRETAKGMKFEGLPREATGLVVSRSVTVDGGKLVEYKHVGFSYLR